MSLCFRFLTPILSLLCILFFIVNHKPLKFYNYLYPGWANALGWILSLASILCVPGWVIFEIYRRPGTFIERLKEARKSQLIIPNQQICQNVLIDDTKN